MVEVKKTKEYLWLGGGFRGREQPRCTQKREGVCRAATIKAGLKSNSAAQEN